MTSSFPRGMKRSAAMTVLRHGDTFLLLRRNKPPHQGKYVPVGGKVEPYEDPYSAARRELEEETGLRLEHLRYCGTLVESSPVEYNWQCSIYLADIDDILPPYCDEGTLEWIPFHQIDQTPTPPTDFQIYRYIMQNRPFALNAIYNAQLQLIKMTEEIAGEVVVAKAGSLGL